MVSLSVNINKVATLRNTRTIGIPSVTHAARLVLDAGAHGITVHPRPDRRHITPQDVEEFTRLMQEYPEAEFNIEGNPFHEYMPLVRQARPTQCTLVPDAPDVFTSNQGWDLAAEGERIKPVVAELTAMGSRVSLFMDPMPEMIHHVADVGADRIELYTEPYASAFAEGNYRETLATFARTAQRAVELGIGVNAGHDLNLKNLGPFLEAVPGVLEVSIGHALIADALEHGLERTVKMYLAIVSQSADG